MFSLCLLVCLQDYAKTAQPTFHITCGKVAYRPQKKPLDFNSNVLMLVSDQKE